jgi:hypothetical protein
MNNEKIEEILKNLGSEELPADVLEIAEHKSRDFEKTLTQSKQPKLVILRDYIMKNPMIKLTAAAAIIIAAGIFLCTTNNMVPAAYALQNTIDAYNMVSSLHIKINETIDESKFISEIWLECDSYGNISRIRYHTPDSGDLDSLTIVESDGMSEAWLPKLNVHLSGYRNLSAILGSEVSQVDPKDLVERLYQQEMLGEVTLDVDEPVQKDNPIVITVTYPKGSLSENWKKVLHIDQGTKLVKKIDKFEFRDEQYQHVSTIELFDYNQQIDPAIFSLEDEIPSDAIVMDMTDVELGLLQGNMTEEETVTEITRQFFEAAIAKDYTRAGQLLIVGPAFLNEQLLEKMNLIKITSIEPARPSTDPDEKYFTCSCKVLLEHGGLFYELNVSRLVVRQINTTSEPNRWMIIGISANIYPLVEE